MDGDTSMDIDGNSYIEHDSWVAAPELQALLPPPPNNYDPLGVLGMLPPSGLLNNIPPPGLLNNTTTPFSSSNGVKRDHTEFSSSREPLYTPAARRTLPASLLPGRRLSSGPTHNTKQGHYTHAMHTEKVNLPVSFPGRRQSPTTSPEANKTPSPVFGLKERMRPYQTSNSPSQRRVLLTSDVQHPHYQPPHLPLEDIFLHKPQRRITVMALSIYNPFASFCGAIWAYITGVPSEQQPPRSIVAVDVDTRGAKRRAIAADTSLPILSSSSIMASTMPTSSAEPSLMAAMAPPQMPGQFPTMLTPPESGDDVIFKDFVMQGAAASDFMQPPKAKKAVHFAEYDELFTWSAQSSLIESKPDHSMPSAEEVEASPSEPMVDGSNAEEAETEPAQSTSDRSVPVTEESMASPPQPMIDSKEVRASPPLPSTDGREIKASPPQPLTDRKEVKASPPQPLTDGQEGRPFAPKLLSISSKARRKVSRLPANAKPMFNREPAEGQKPFYQYPAVRDAYKDAEIEALITRTKTASMVSPEQQQLRKSWNERKQREAEQTEVRMSDAEIRANREAEEERAYQLYQEEEARRRDAALLRLEQKKADDAAAAAAADAAAQLSITPAEESEETVTVPEILQDMPHIPQEIEPEITTESPVVPDIPVANKEKLIRPLDEEWAFKLNEAMKTKNKTHVITKTVDGAELTRHDFGTLLPQADAGDSRHGWLNDNIVNSFISTIVDSKHNQTGYDKQVDRVPEFVAYPSMWYNNYDKSGMKGIETWSRRKKIKGEKLLRAEKIFFPVNTGSHWMLLIISPKARKIEFLDSWPSPGRHAEFCNIAREWLKMELGSKYVAAEWADVQSISARQKNGNDCGAFVCFNALASAKEKPYSDVGEGPMAYGRSIMAAVLLNGGFHGDWVL